METTTKMPSVTQPLMRGSCLMETATLRYGLGLALVADLHPLIVGPPGHAKTESIRELFDAIDLDPDQKLIISGYKGAGEEILVGYPSVASLQKNEYRLMPGKSLLNVALAYVDEIDKLNRPAQQALLQIMQNRSWSRAGFDLKNLPLMILIGGGNAEPEDPAVRDRFGIQIPVELSQDGIQALVWWQQNKISLQKKNSISIEHLRQLRERRKNVVINPGARKRITEIAQEYNCSPRRIVQYICPAIQASAVLDGRPVADERDLAAVIPYVVLHQGKLTIQRFEEVKARYQELALKMREAERVKDITDSLKKIRDRLQQAYEVWDTSRSAKSAVIRDRTLTKSLREISNDFNSMAVNPDEFTQGGAEQIRELLQSIEQWQRHLLASLKLV